MSVDQFATGPTRDVQPGDTPDLNDGLLSRSQTNQNIPRGLACYIVDGDVITATQTISLTGAAPFVPIESVDNSGGSAGDTEISGVTAPQRVAVTIRGDTTDGVIFHPGSYLKISDDTPGQLHLWNNGDADASKYCRFLGIEAALLDRAVATPFDETLTPGIVPDQTVTVINAETFVGWVQLKENEDT